MDEVDAGGRVLALVAETLVDVALAAVAGEAGRARAAEAALLQQVARAPVAARPPEARVDLLLATAPVEAGRARALEATPTRRRARSPVRTREQVARVALGKSDQLFLVAFWFRVVSVTLASTEWSTLEVHSKVAGGAVSSTLSAMLGGKEQRAIPGSTKSRLIHSLNQRSPQSQYNGFAPRALKTKFSF